MRATRGVMTLVAGTLFALVLGGCSSCDNDEPGGGSPSSDGGPGGTNGQDASVAGGSSSGNMVSSSGASSSGASSTMSSSGGTGTTITITAPANNGTTVTEAILVDSTINFAADITTPGTIDAAKIAWTLTAPDATVTTSGGALSGTTASFSALLAQEGSYTIRISYDDGTQPVPAAQLVVPVYSNLPPQLAWIAPENDGTAVTGPRRAGTTLSMQVALSDDDPLLPQNVAWTHTKPDASVTTSQGMFMANGPTSAQLSLLVDLADVGMHSVSVAYSDGTHMRTLTLGIQVLSDLPPVTTFTSPSNDGTTVTLPVAVTDALTFQVTISDDTTILPQNSSFAVTTPAGMTTTNQGMITANGTSADASLSVTFNAEGTWTIAHRYSDGVNAQVETSLTVVVAMDPAPVVRITAPANDGTALSTDIRENTAITFTGSIQDNAAIAPQSVLWTFTSSTGMTQTSQGTISGTGGAVTTDFMVPDVGAAGTATIALRYSDAGGSTRTVQLSISVLSATAPLVVITAPAADGTQVRTGTVVNFAASISDDAAIIPSNIAWTLTSPGGGTQSSPGGFMGGTATFSAALTAPGTWSAQVRYVDATNQQGASTRTVIVVANALPTCTFTPVAACVSAGDVAIDVTLADADGDTPISALITSSNAADVVAPSMVSGNGRRTVTVTFNAAGARTLRCVPTDAAGGVGAAATLDVPVVGAPTIAISAPAADTIVSSGSNVTVSITSMSDPGAAPAAITVHDSISGTIAVTSGSGTITAPVLGFHDITADIADACMGSDSATVRYAVTTGGAATSTLFPTTTITTDARVAAVDDAGHLLVGTAQSGVRRLDVTTRMDASYQPNASGLGGNVPTMQGVRDISIGRADAQGRRREAYATSAGVFFCVNLTGTMGDACQSVNGSQDVTDVLVMGEGIADGIVFVTGSPNGLRIYNAAGMLEDTIDEGGDVDQVLGEVQDIVAANPSSVGLPASFFVATDKGVSRVTVGAQGQVTAIEHYDENRTQNLLPDYDVRAIAVDPGNIESQWFATAGGIGHHLGPGFGAATWSSITRSDVDMPSEDLTAVALDRFPDAQRPILWFGTANAGAFRLDANGTPLLLTPISTADGMPSNSVRHIVINSADPAHIKWFSTPQGVWGYVGQ